MCIIYIQDFLGIKGEKFPSGRLTRVLVSPNNKLKANNFVMGSVVIDIKGSVPKHSHSNEEIYIILKGKGLMMIGKETELVEAKSVVYIPPNEEHTLVNNGNTLMEMIFVYSPANIVNHWEKERKGKI